MKDFLVICDSASDCQRDQNTNCIHAHPHRLRDGMRLDYRISCVFSPSQKAHFSPQPFVIVENERELP